MEFLEALQRLQEGRPRNRDLAQKAKKDGIRISISAVAKEAGRSRTLIGHDECQYPRVRQRVLAAMAPVLEPRTAQDVIKRLREGNADLRAQLSLSRSQNAALVMRMAQVEKNAKRLVREAQREAAVPKRESLQVAGRGLEGSNVVAIQGRKTGKASTEEPSDE
ncbi:hypothetical protein GAY29_04090 [Azospirillum brasilense]|uniref:hypothetical protein n=1 Tax=Azospirillum brasilense TaxID=192 RepID=UPI00190C9876|nr:hypothetical protein [Azospirillum brasilense]MBK3732291.1 hypothetical protein [Azospirillum brasilense]